MPRTLKTPRSNRRNQPAVLALDARRLPSIILPIAPLAPTIAHVQAPPAHLVVDAYLSSEAIA